MKNLITEIQKLSLTENDILVVKGTQPMSRAQLDRLQEIIKNSLNIDITTIYVNKDVKFEKMSKGVINLVED